MSLPIVIIGAGLSGLYTSWLLNRSGLRTTLVEARPRIGGRILTHAAGDRGHGLDMGPAWYWPEMNPRMQALTEQLGLKHYPQHADGALMIEAPDGRVQIRHDTWVQAPSSHRLVGGLKRLVEALGSQLGDLAHLMLSTRLMSLKLRPGGVELELQDEGGRWTQMASRVIVTIPPRLLAQDVPMIPAWPEAVLAEMRRTPTWMAGQAKFVAAYSKSFWRDQGLSGTAVSHRGPMIEIHDASDNLGSEAALFGFIGTSADYRKAIGDEELKRQCVAQLGRLFGADAAEPTWSAVQDWAQEPYTATPLDQHSAAYHPSYRQGEVPTLWSRSLWLAGSERSPDFGGYLEGALESAERAVESVLINLGDPTIAYVATQDAEVSP